MSRVMDDMGQTLGQCAESERTSWKGARTPPMMPRNQSQCCLNYVYTSLHTHVSRMHQARVYVGIASRLVLFGVA